MVYLDGGVGYEIKIRGKAPGMKVLPHREFWGAVLGLVADGVGITPSQLQQKMSSAGGGDLSEKLAQGSAGPEAPRKPPAAEGPGPRAADVVASGDAGPESGEESDGSDVVE